MIVQQKYF